MISSKLPKSSNLSVFGLAGAFSFPSLTSKNLLPTRFLNVLPS